MYNELWCYSVQEECLWMTHFCRNSRQLKFSTNKLYYSNVHKIQQDDVFKNIFWKTTFTGAESKAVCQSRFLGKSSQPVEQSSLANKSSVWEDTVTVEQ